MKKATIRKLERRVGKGEVQRRALGFRRCAPLVLYWQDGELVFENYAQRTQICAEPAACSILHLCDEWRTFEEIAALLNEYDERSIRKSLNELCENGVLEKSDGTPDPRMEAMKCWASWSPAASFFHFSTKDTKFAPDPMGAIREWRRRINQEPMPVPIKSYSKAPKTRLPRGGAAGEFPATLRGRRTWRKFGGEAVTLDALGQVLELTFGIQGWVEVPGLGRAAMKTSPSGGDLHPIEAYVLAQRVRGLKKGIYHYNAARHELERLGGGIPRPMLERSLGNQWWFAGGAFLVLMTAVFGRAQWKYDFPRAYRVVLAEAGHLCQTFCLTATWLGLAPFCTMAQADTKWEEWLGIDGVTESIIYAAGAGTRPKDMRGAHIGKLGKGPEPNSFRRPGRQRKT